MPEQTTEQAPALAKLEWKTAKRKISDLIEFEHNPRQMTSEQVEQLTKSLEKFNLVEIPAVNLDNRIIAGHQRLKIMAMLGRSEEEIDVRVPNRALTEEEFKEYNLRSNKNTGEWDWEVMANAFDIEMLTEVGFDKDDIMFGEVAGTEVSSERMIVITVEPPEAPRLKEHMSFRCSSIEEYKRICKEFEQGENDLDINKLLKLL